MGKGGFCSFRFLFLWYVYSLIIIVWVRFFMNELRIFENPQFGKVRTAGTTDNPLFCLADVCNAVGLSAKGVNQRLSDEVISNYPIIDNLGRTQQALFVNEDGLYDVILDSRKPEAKAFRKWVTKEVLPSIRKHGAYMTDNIIERTLADPDYLIQLATTLKAERQKRIEAEQSVKDAQPAITFTKAVRGSVSSCLIGELAKLINQNGTPMGEKRLFQWMRDNGYLGTKGERYNIPNQKYVDMGLFELKKGVRSGNNGVLHTTITTKVTGKGQVYFVNKFNNH
ncbi:phage antirepressor KilAC domain-containing protein [Prevotella histicola]|nr:phage antirepressor KilAC domain-containing protein [Prevotella histicola]